MYSQFEYLKYHLLKLFMFYCLSRKTHPSKCIGLSALKDEMLKNNKRHAIIFVVNNGPNTSQADSTTLKDKLRVTLHVRKAPLVFVCVYACSMPPEILPEKMSTAIKPNGKCPHGIFLKRSLTSRNISDGKNLNEFCPNGNPPRP